MQRTSSERFGATDYNMTENQEGQPFQKTYQDAEANQIEEQKFIEGQQNVEDEQQKVFSFEEEQAQMTG